MTEKLQGTAAVYQNGQTVFGPLACTLEITRKKSGKMFGWCLESTRNLSAAGSARARILGGTWEYLNVEFTSKDGATYWGQSRIVPMFLISGSIRLELFSELEIHAAVATLEPCAER